MKHLSYLVASLFCVSAMMSSLTSCTAEEELTPSGARDNYFAVDPDATDAESVLKRKFYADNDVYLLFGDTLFNEYLGTDANGKPYYHTETVDINYGLISTSNNDFQITYLTPDQQAEKEKAAKLVEKYIFSHMGNALRPYSVMLVGAIQNYEYVIDYDNYIFGYEWVVYYLVPGMRCHMIAATPVLAMNEEELDEWATDVLYQMLYAALSSKDEALADFYAYSSAYYQAYKSELGLEPYGTLDSDVYPYGMLKNSSYILGSQSADLEAYLQVILSMTEEEIQKTYGDYDIIMKKFKIMRNLLLELGYKY